MKHDWWFDEEIPKATYGSLQCWIDNKNTKKWVSDTDLSIHSLMYEMASISHTMLGGSILR